ncbi:hypothetical protein A2419_00835 [Candidatus Adlerbacteria bacterium RIFOXYC1_FULL_48_26]|uniref:Uncharacterized protein n=1 Tax=Candidatus Adlerbacteria bacterium RIFOXYC1_FULL_48_26 TaxID=1797247 RepID=A0A1F4Y1Z8_9BACT|nr:MAG: hypothetical protein A2419_00835 [Candidatus Adlerbacteria bacterium RIFOXYC1_FULL_48_26]OGC93341.1 MAG: hypothetical protein A2389_01835 [Candidatus Adlerbacteria bacterium RIFOXYB1_FULL_48_10]
MRSCVDGNDVVGFSPGQSAERGLALTLFTNAMQRGYTALHQLGLPKNELQAIYSEIEKHAATADKAADPNVESLLSKLAEKIPAVALVPSGGWGDILQER